MDPNETTNVVEAAFPAETTSFDWKRPAIIVAGTLLGVAVVAAVSKALSNPGTLEIPQD